MLTPNDIADRLEELIRKQFPGEDVHRDLCPQGFSRPCSLIVLGKCPGNIHFGTGILELRPLITMTTFVEVDEYHHSHLRELHRRQMLLTGLLLPGYLQVGDRAPKVLEAALDGGFDYDTVAVTFSYTLSRSDFTTIAQRPPMEQLHLRTEATTYG